MEARDLLALEVLAPRLSVLAIDLATELLAIVRLSSPVPCMGADGTLVVRRSVDLALCYPEEILRGPLAGYALVAIPTPANIWHPNVSQTAPQRLCLGANVPTGFPLREAVLGSFAALSLQSIALDPADPAGILNLEALEYWNDHAERIPLTGAAFLDAPEADGDVAAEREEGAS